jgi:type IX secretion system PorP/SprF family membrane protein
MKTSSIIILAMVLTLPHLQSDAQQAPMYTHYMYNTLSVNPAYAGSRGALTMTALHRSQWVDFKGAPMTQTFTMHSPLRNEYTGIGLSILNDKIGPTNNTSVFAHYAYIMKLSEKSKLAFGLSAGANIFQADLNTLILDDPSDPVFQNNIENRVTPNFGFGIYFSRERFYAGLSAPNLLENSYATVKQPDGTLLASYERRHYYFITGALFNLSDDLALKPTVLVKATPAAPIQADLTATFIIMEKLLIGGMFRTGDAAGILAGLNISEQLTLGYSFDFSFGLETSRYNKGSHEIMLRYDFIFPGRKQIQTPRHF